MEFFIRLITKMALRCINKIPVHVSKVCDSGVIADRHTLTVNWLIGRVHRLKHLLPKRILSLLYYSLVLPHLDYCNVIWGRTTQTNLQKLQTLQNRYARMILNAEFLTPNKQMLQILQWQSVKGPVTPTRDHRGAPTAT